MPYRCKKFCTKSDIKSHKSDMFYSCAFFWYSLGVTPKYFLNCSVK